LACIQDKAEGQVDIQWVIAFLIGVFIGIDVHEFAHAWAADRLGDPTARYQGRLTLNPLAHLDPVGTIMILAGVLYHFGIGWGKPVPVNPYNLRKSPRVGMAMVAVAGPLANLLLASLVAIPLRLLLPMPRLLLIILGVTVSANIGLALFNLLPLPPLDGFNVLMGILSTMRTPYAYRWYMSLSKLEAQGPLALLAFLFLDYILPISLVWTILGPPYTLLSRLILGF